MVDVKKMWPLRINGFNWKLAKKLKVLYLLLLIPVAWVLIFNYEPMYGVIMAFKDYKLADGIFGSKWNNFEYFRMFFSSPNALGVIRNTIIINIANLVFGFPAPIILALLVNEIKALRFKKVFQTISYLPYFLSWVVLATIFTELLSPQTGIVNYFLSVLGIEPVYFLANKNWFRQIVVSTGIWQNVGWGSIVYLASIASINPELYEASEIDGASRFQRALHITLPSITPIIVFFLIMSMGSLLRSNFEQIFNLQNSSVMEIAEVIDTYVYHVGLVEANYGFATAIGLLINLVGIIMLFIANNVIKKFSEYTIW